MEFRILNEQEHEEFRRWADDNWSPDQLKPDELWHPTVRHRWLCLSIAHLTKMLEDT